MTLLLNSELKDLAIIRTPEAKILVAKYLRNYLETEFSGFAEIVKTRESLLGMDLGLVVKLVTTKLVNINEAILQGDVSEAFIVQQIIDNIYFSENSGGNPFEEQGDRLAIIQNLGDFYSLTGTFYPSTNPYRNSG